MLRLILTAWILVAAALADQTVEGHVVNSVTGQGIPGVTVNLHQAVKNYAATTDSQGRFHIEAVKDGVYTANYRAAGFWPVPNSMNGGGPQPTFQVSADRTVVHLEAKMQPAGKISGRVLDASGKPVPNASVWCYWASSNIVISPISKADEKGEYSFSDLEVPGPWSLSALAPPSLPLPDSRDNPKLAWVQTFYPGVTDSRLAAPVLLPPGGELRLDIKLAAVPVHRLRGVVVDMRGDPVAKVSVTLGKDTRSPIRHQNTSDDGGFEFESVADGEWGLSTKVDTNSAKQWADQRVQVKGLDLEHVELRLTP